MSDDLGELARMAANLERASVTVAARAGVAMSKASQDIRGRAQSLAPVDTGALKNSISVSDSRQGATLRSEIGPTVSYGNLVERGTSRMRAQPYLRPATDAVLPGYEAALEQIGAEILD